MIESAMGDDLYLDLVKALAPVAWTYGSPYLTRGVVWVLLHVMAGVSPLAQGMIASTIGAIIGALTGTMDAMPLHSGSAAIMGACSGAVGQKLLAATPGKIQGEQ